jgi:formimidoylglutamate deiminase
MVQALQAALTYVDDRFVEGVAVLFEDGRIVDVKSADQLSDDVRVERRAGSALLPGMVNAHSHAFQRAIRGWTQWRPMGEDADFWSWREAMYRAVLRISPDDLYELSLFCFIEMLLAGYTTVGEFHYVHRDERGQAYSDQNELALQVVRAAHDAGIRIALLSVCYATGNVGQPLRDEQRRFATPELSSYLESVEQLQKVLASNALASVGVAPHSVRAVPREWLQPIGQFARQRDLPLHMHVAEQPAEVAACVEVYGQRPGDLVAGEGLLDDRFTAIHATHLSPTEIVSFGQAAATVCACPTTERDLGDGILAAAELMAGGARICIGSDSQTIIDPWEEVRSIEYHTRLAKLRRVVLAEPTDPGRNEVAPNLLRAGSANGAHALRVATGQIARGRAADFVLVDLEHPTLAGWTPATLAAHLALSAPAAVVREVWVGGKLRIEEGRHAAQAAARRAFDSVCERVLA